MHEKYFQSCPMPFEPWDAVRVFVSSPFGVCCSRFCPGLSISDACLAPVGVSMSRLGTSLNMLGTPLTLPSPCRLLWLLQGGWVFPRLLLDAETTVQTSWPCVVLGSACAASSALSVGRNLQSLTPATPAVTVPQCWTPSCAARRLESQQHPSSPVIPPLWPPPHCCPAWVGRAQLLSSIGVQSRWPSLERVPALNLPGA